MQPIFWGTKVLDVGPVMYHSMLTGEEDKAHASFLEYNLVLVKLVDNIIQ